MAVNGETLLFGVHYPNNKQWDRMLFILLNRDKPNTSDWKLCSMQYLGDGKVNIDASHPLFGGIATFNGKGCILNTVSQRGGGDRVYAVCEWAAAGVDGLKPDDLGSFCQSDAGGMVHILRFVRRAPVQTYYQAMVPQALA